MNNTLIAAGPGFKSGVRSAVPSGNIDIAPTILHLLGISHSVPMDGRVLTEALKGGPSPESVRWQKTNHDAKRGSGSSAFAQRIVTSTVGGTTYVDQGNAL
jgi:arylsulfatase A-like enzyme